MSFNIKFSIQKSLNLALIFSLLFFKKISTEGLFQLANLLASHCFGVRELCLSLSLCLKECSISLPPKDNSLSLSATRSTRSLRILPFLRQVGRHFRPEFCFDLDGCGGCIILRIGNYNYYYSLFPLRTAHTHPSSLFCLSSVLFISSSARSKN